MKINQRIIRSFLLISLIYNMNHVTAESSGSAQNGDTTVTNEAAEEDGPAGDTSLVVDRDVDQWSERHYHHDWWDDWWDKRRNCPMGTRRISRLEVLLDNLFPGLFVGLDRLKEIVLGNLAWKISLSKPILILNEPDPVTTTPEPGGDPKNNFPCCSLSTLVVKPVKVQQNGMSFNVVHLDENDQLITTSSCRRPNARCNTSGRCTTKKGYNWVLVYDLTVNYYPPVKFIPLEIDVGCECL